MKTLSAIADLPKVAAVYALYGGQGKGYVAYVGVANKLKGRIRQHLVRRNSSVATGTSAAVLNPNYVTQVVWWEHPDFTNRNTLEAAELVAFDVLQPTLRSRGKVTDAVQQLYEDADFYKAMQDLFENPPVGKLVLPTLEEAMKRIEDLADRVSKLEAMLQK